MDVWRAFENNVITHSAAHHIMTISKLLAENGYARVTDVAKRLGISRSSVSITLKTLKERGYIQEDENKFLILSEEGRKLSRSIKSKRHILIEFFRDVLQVDPEQAEVDACKIEHLLSQESSEKLLTFMRLLRSSEGQFQLLLKSYEKQEHFCDGDTNECDICEDECFIQV